jgi:hypothetical protein
MQSRDRVRVFFHDLLDVDPAAGRDHREMQLGRPVEREARVVLLGDVRRLLDPQAAHRMALDVHAKDVARVLCDLRPGVGELHPACFAAAAYLHLGLHDHGIAEPFGGGFGFGHGVRDFPARCGQAITREVLLALVLN